MEVVIAIISIYGFFWFVGFIFEEIGKWNDERKRKIRDDIAYSLLGSDFSEKTNNYKQKFNIISVSSNKKDGLSYFKQHLDVLFNDCPKCGNGRMVERKGKYGKFYGCSHFPSCTYTKDLKEMALELKESAKNNFIDDFNKAYK